MCEAWRKRCENVLEGLSGQASVGVRRMNGREEDKSKEPVIEKLPGTQYDAKSIRVARWH